MRRTPILFFAGCAIAVAAIYGLFHWFGPESAAPNPAAMRQYRLSQLSDADLKKIVEQARKDRAESAAQREVSAKEAEERRREEQAARQKTRAQCDSDPVFKLRNEKLCTASGGGFILSGPIVPDVPLPSEDEFVEGYIMGPCSYARTVREARQLGCLAPR